MDRAHGLEFHGLCGGRLAGIRHGRAAATSQSDAPADKGGDADQSKDQRSVEETAKEAAKDVASKVSDVAEAVNRDERAKQATESVLSPIYRVAQWCSFPAFHWVAFALMVAGVVSFAGQLVLGKLVALMYMHFSLMEIFADALGLLISVVGLVLTTQAATENSTFTESPMAVLSATIVGALVGFVCYVWGQSQELKAARAAKAASRQKGK